LPAATTVSQSDDPLADAEPGLAGCTLALAAGPWPQPDRTSQLASKGVAHIIEPRVTFMMLRLLR
jgi:hypothetical protein